MWNVVCKPTSKNAELNTDQKLQFTKLELSHTVNLCLGELGGVANESNAKRFGLWQVLAHLEVCGHHVDHLELFVVGLE